MSEDNAPVDTSCCAFCGIAEVDDIELKECVDCDLVEYCSGACQKNHWPQNAEDCKKRAAELRDEILFRQPESSNHWGDCPICCLPLPLDYSKSTMMVCCSKIICNGCSHANKIREAEASLHSSCPFCREPLPTKSEGCDKQTKDEVDKRRMKRIEVNDPVAMTQWGLEQYVKGNYSSAFEHFTRAAELGDLEAHYQLADLYRNGHGVEKDEGMEMYHLEEAAIGGHPYARFNLGCLEGKDGRHERGVRHWIIAAKSGCDHSIKPLVKAFRIGMMSKDDLAAALRAHQAAVDAAKSPQRAAAEEFRRKRSSAESIL